MYCSKQIFVNIFYLSSFLTICFASRASNHLLGGQTTVFIESSRAFSQPAKNLPVQQLRQFTFGNRLFNTQWVSASDSVRDFDGLGPLFSRNSCSSCHLKDGRGHPPQGPHERLNSMSVQLSIKISEDQVITHPLYGEQIDEQSITGFKPEGQIFIEYKETAGYFPEGELFTLRQPSYQLQNLAYGEIEGDILFSGRVAPAVHGLGLLEAIPELVILQYSDAEDKNKDGISGRPSWVVDLISGQMVLGRFGWKARQPNIVQQVATAFLHDIGITTNIMPDEKWISQSDPNKKVVSGGKPELNDTFLQKITFYLQTLAVPSQRNWNDPKVVSGRKLFDKIGCASCHRPHFKTGTHPISKALSDQEIYPFSDLLLHDMGPGLADNRPEASANGREWRTPPLWGIGLINVVNGHTNFLHDGRARNLKEAILWHGGEAERSKRNFMHLSKANRDKIISFLNSL